MPSARERLWLPVVAPAIWSSHFLICYAIVALACGRLAAALPEPRVRSLLLVVTVAAMAAMGWCLRDGWRRLDSVWPVASHDDDSPRDRRYFMAFTTVLLAGLSLVATVFEAVAMLTVRRCT